MITSIAPVARWPIQFVTVFGWDLTCLESRKTTTFASLENPTQTYDARAALLVAQATAVLDLGTGDGRRFARYAPFPSIAWATEGYTPNVPLAARRLSSLGVQVVQLARTADGQPLATAPLAICGPGSRSGSSQPVGVLASRGGTYPPLGRGRSDDSGWDRMAW